MHLVTGHFAGQGLARVRSHDEVFAFPDVLSCGPAVDVTVATISNFIAERARFWSQLPGGADAEPPAGLAEGLLRACSAPTVTVWLGASASEQLFAALFCALVAAREQQPTIHVIPYREVPNRLGAMVRVRAMSMLSERELSNPPPSIELAAEEVIALAEGWAAWTSPDPGRLVGLCGQSDTPAVLWTALRSLLGRYPDRASGLGYWDLALLRSVRAHGPRLARVIGHTLGEAETDDIVGDGWLFWRLRRMAEALPNPLVAFDSTSSQMRACNVSVTQAGSLVVEGAANAITLNGLDDWIGGVHLRDTEGQAWVREGEEIVRWAPPV